MAATQNRRPPVFFWQGLLIMLPVVVLAAASFLSLRQDERLAESDARNRAEEDVQSFGRAIRTSADEELQRYLTLQGLSTNPRFELKSSGSGAFSPEKLQEDIQNWEHDYPGLNFAELEAPGVEILADGRQIFPRDYPAVPTPPKWFRELTPEQRKLWEALRAAQSPTEIEKCMDEFEFEKSDPSEEARAAARELHCPAEQLISHTSIVPSETGVSFEEIACYRLLSATNARLSDKLLQSLWWQATQNPSSTLPKLLAMAAGLTNSADPELRRDFFFLQQDWHEQLKVRQWLEMLRQYQLPELKNWDKKHGKAFWVDGFDGDALAFFDPHTVADLVNEADSVLPSGSGYAVSFVPREVVDAIFDRALNENRVFIPDYASAAVTVEGRPFVSLFYHSLWHSKIFTFPYSPGKRGVTDDEILGQLHWQLMGTTTERIPVFAGAAGFEVNLYLVNREQMLSTERRRAKLFGALILGAALTAFVGLFTARWAFRRQLQLNEQKSNFVSSVSHELRAPIASVRLMAENLERGKIPEPAKQGEYFRFIVQECRRLSSLIENVLDFSRIEQGRKQYEFEPTNLAALVETTVKLMEPCAAEKGVALKLETFNIQHSTFNIELNIDGRAIQQALVNLIDNAVKHSHKGDTVTVGVEIKNAKIKMQNGVTDAVSLFVADHGPGISAAEHQKIFERFYRLGSELRRETQGVGIGLSVVKHIVEAHGGRVGVESEPGKGSRFTIKLPTANARAQRGQDAEKA